MHWGQGNGLSLRSLGEAGGENAVTLLPAQMPLHNHTVQSSALNAGQVNAASGNFPAKADTPDPFL